MEKQIPQFLKDLLIEQYGEEISAKIENGYKAQRPVTLRVNNLKTSLEKAKEKLDEAQIEYETISWYEKALIIKNVREEEIRKLEIFTKFVINVATNHIRTKSWRKYIRHDSGTWRKNYRNSSINRK